MPQLHFSLDPETATRLRQRAEQAGVPLSRYLADLARREVSETWSPGWLAAVVGSCAESPLAVPDDLPLDDVTL